MNFSDYPNYPTQPIQTPTLETNAFQSYPHSYFKSTRGCSSTEVYKTLPPNKSSKINIKNEARGPTSIKSIYTGIPNYYPYIREYKPTGTLYDNDYTF
jgi:hypothetical protein